MYYRRGRSIAGGLSGAIVLIGLALAFPFGEFNLPIFFVALAFAALVGSLSSGNPRGAYGGLYGFMWLLILALFFITHSWIWFLVGAALSAVLSALARPILAGLLGAGLFGMMQSNQQPQQTYYQPPVAPYQPPQQPYQSYQQGYQAPETYQEGGRQYPYPPQATPSPEQPQAQYPQEMPPPQQG